MAELRTWTLEWDEDGYYVGAQPHDAVSVLGDDESVEVVEKAAVDEERKRMLDLLERAEAVLSLTVGPGPPAVLPDVRALLREHGRLGGQA